MSAIQKSESPSGDGQTHDQNTDCKILAASTQEAPLRAASALKGTAVQQLDVGGYLVGGWNLRSYAPTCPTFPRSPIRWEYRDAL